MITENNNYRQVACENCGGVIMKVIVMKLEMISCVAIILILIAQDKCEDIVTSKVSRKLAV